MCYNVFTSLFFHRMAFCSRIHCIFDHIKILKMTSKTVSEKGKKDSISIFKVRGISGNRYLTIIMFFI